MNIYKYIEVLILFLYLFFIFISIQIWFLWKDVDKNELKKFIVKESFFRKNCAYIFFFGVFFSVHNFSDGIALQNAYFQIFELLASASLVSFTYEWYRKLKPCAHKKSLPIELTNFHHIFR